MPTEQGKEILEVENRFLKLSQDNPRVAARIFTAISSIGAKLMAGDEKKMEAAVGLTILYLEHHGVSNTEEMVSDMKILRQEVLLQGDKRPDPKIV